MITLAEKIVAIHRALDRAGLPHAFGGALALAWCTQRARGTIDIDVNIFVGVDAVERSLAALPDEVVHTAADVAQLVDDGQARLWWDGTPIDVFLSTGAFHEAVAERTVTEQFAGHDIPFLSCSDLAVFKAFFDRPRDWADLQEMHAAGTLDVERVLGALVRYVGADERVERLRTLTAN